MTSLLAMIMIRKSIIDPNFLKWQIFEEMWEQVRNPVFSLPDVASSCVKDHSHHSYGITGIPFEK